MSKTKEIVNLHGSIKPAVEGEDYYFQNKGVIAHGTCVRCDKCNAACVSNRMTVTSFNVPVITITVNEEMKDAGELGYDEDSQMCLCEDCN
jgi:heterodisulfide reductase subunit C